MERERKSARAAGCWRTREETTSRRRGGDEGDAEGSARSERGKERRGDGRRETTEIDGIESEREAGETSRKEAKGKEGGEMKRRDLGDARMCARTCVCNAVHRTSRSRMESEARGGGEG